MKIGDIINIPTTTTYTWYLWGEEQSKAIGDFSGTYKVFDIKEDKVGIEFTEYTGECYYYIKQKDLEMKYKVGDKFTIPKEYKNIPYSTEYNPKNWELDDWDYKEELEIFKITKTQVYFNLIGEGLGSCWIMKKSLFESIAVFEDNSGKITGYELLKDTPDAKAGTVMSVEGNYTSISGDAAAYGVQYLSDCEWFKPIYKPKSVTLTGIGTRGVTLIIDKNRITIAEKGEDLDINKIKEIYNYLSDSKDLGSYSLILIDSIECFRVGCEGEDNRVSLEDMRKVIDAYQSL